MKNNIAQIRDLSKKGVYPALAQKLKQGNINIDAIVAEEYNQMLEVERRLKCGIITNPLPKKSQLPYGFNSPDEDGSHRAAWFAQVGRFQGLFVLGLIAIYEDLAWYHVSFSRKDKIPSYQDITMIKDEWFGKDLWAIQVHPKADEHVNIAPTCLHLWSCLEDGFHLPDFRFLGVI